jgi:methyltransferase (TIGR00027 family)
MRGNVSRTAQLVAMYRAFETISGREPPLFRDPFAEAFLSRRLRLALRAARIRPLRHQLARYADLRAPGARTSAIGRTAFIDGVVRDAVARGTKQLVLLGAGYDCRAHRMPELESVTVFEVDRAEMQQTKRARLAQLARRSNAPATRTRDDVRYVPVDFLRDDPAEKLAAAGWDRTKPTVFVWEGVTNYLTEQAVTDVLSWIGTAAPGSTLVFTYIHGGLIDGSFEFAGGEKMLKNVRRLGEPWIFGLHPEAVGPFVARFGLELRENVGADEYRRRYFGDSEPNAGGYAFYRIAVADVGGSSSSSSSKAWPSAP